ncbi:hypothetical protein FG379_000280 [Cryptosporidium bovis]|uniref:uncharacterized protein n=1 Tax=Cryptosporidium bovis TaxID=310047 RepID=UPI00351A69F4|nr:hypothetical protein FG379_000280 [Cryptosporidium bovis]
MKLTIPFLPRNSSFDFIKNNYRIIEYVGKGQFGSTYKVENIIDNEIWLAKCIDLSQMDDDDKKRSLQEAEIMKNISNPYVIKCHESFIYDDIYLVIVMEYCNNGDIGKVIESCIHKNEYLSEEIILKWSSQLAAGIYYLHSECKIIHRDIKPSNIFIRDNGDIVIGDLGISRIMQSMSMSFTLTSIGTPQYMSPEMCENKPYTYKSDIWSFGCVLYELITLKPPFSGNSLLSLAWNISFQEIEPLPDCFSKELFALIKQLLSRNPTIRPNPDQILDNLIFSKYKKSLLYIPLKEKNGKGETNFTNKKYASTENDNDINNIVNHNQNKINYNNNNYNNFDFQMVNKAFKELEKYDSDENMENNYHVHNNKKINSRFMMREIKNIKSVKKKLNDSKSQKMKTFPFFIFSNILIKTNSIFDGIYFDNDEYLETISEFYYQYFSILVGRIKYHLFNYIEKSKIISKKERIYELFIKNLKCCYGIDIKREQVTIEWFSKFVQELNIGISEAEQYFFLKYIEYIIHSKVTKNKNISGINNIVDNRIKYKNTFDNLRNIEYIKAFKNNKENVNTQIFKSEINNYESIDLLNEIESPKICDFIDKMFIWNKIQINNKNENITINKNVISSPVILKVADEGSNSRIYNKRYLNLLIIDWMRLILKPITLLNNLNNSKYNREETKNITLIQGFQLFDQKNNGSLSKQHFKTVLYLLFPKITSIQSYWLFALAPKDYYGNVKYYEFLDFIDNIHNDENNNKRILVDNDYNTCIKDGFQKNRTITAGKFVNEYNFISNNIVTDEEVNNHDEIIPGILNLYYEIFNDIFINYDIPLTRIKEKINLVYCQNILANDYFEYNNEDIFLNSIQDISLLQNKHKYNLKTPQSTQLLTKIKNNSLIDNSSNYKIDIELADSKFKKILESNKNNETRMNNNFKLLINENYDSDINSVKMYFSSLKIENITEFEFDSKYEMKNCKPETIISEKYCELILTIINYLEKLIQSIQIERLYTCWSTAITSKSNTLFDKVFKLKETRNESSDILIKLIFLLGLFEKENKNNQGLKCYSDKIYELKNILITLENDLSLQRDAIDCMLKIVDKIEPMISINYNNENAINVLNNKMYANNPNVTTNNYKNIFRQIIKNKTEFASNKKYVFKYDNLEKDKEFCEVDTTSFIKTDNRNEEINFVSNTDDFDWIGKFLASFEFFSEIIIYLIQCSINIISVLNKKKGKKITLCSSYLIENYREWSYLKEHVSRECAFVASMKVNKDLNEDLETIRVFLELLGARRHQVTVTFQKQNKIERKLFRELFILEELLWNSQKQIFLSKDKMTDNRKFNTENWLFIGEKTCIALHNTCIKLINEILTLNK